MSYNETSGFYEGIIPAQAADTWVKYEIIAYDNAENQAEQNNANQYFVYHIIPEFPSTIILLLVMILATVVTILTKRRFFKNAKSDVGNCSSGVFREKGREKGRKIPRNKGTKCVRKRFHLAIDDFW